MSPTASTAADETIELLLTSATSFTTRHASAQQSTPETLWSEMAELGWHGLLLPESLGGSALNLRAADDDPTVEHLRRRQRNSARYHREGGARHASEQRRQVTRFGNFD